MIDNLIFKIIKKYPITNTKIPLFTNTYTINHCFSFLEIAIAHNFSSSQTNQTLNILPDISRTNLMKWTKLTFEAKMIGDEDYLHYLFTSNAALNNMNIKDTYVCCMFC